MSATGLEERTVDWAVNLFRPLLKDLGIQKLKDQSMVFTANYKAFQKYHMDSCVVIVKRYKFSKQNYKGVFIWQYNEKNEMFALYIILNENMYTTTLEKNEIFRKAVSTHYSSYSLFWSFIRSFFASASFDAICWNAWSSVSPLPSACPTSRNVPRENAGSVFASAARSRS